MRWEMIRTIAFVGASQNQERPVYAAMLHFKAAGFRAIPINPSYPEVQGEKCYPSLLDVPEEIARTIDMADIFVSGKHAARIAQDAAVLRRKYGNLKVFWMQPGAHNDEAVRICSQAGIEAISNACAMASHSTYVHTPSR